MRFISGSFLLLLVLSVTVATAQKKDSLRTINLKAVDVQARKSFFKAAPIGMYEQSNPDNSYENIAGFASLVILEGASGDELWTDKKKGCFNYDMQADTAYRLRWDKPGGGCNWVGMGIGWDQWSGKNLAPLLDSAAIELKVRIPAGKPVKTLPLAFGIEDYSNRQAWLGMSAKWVVDGPIGQQYAHIRLPLQQFNWDEQGADPTNVKQFIIQFEAAGEVDLRHIKIVRFQAATRNQAVARPAAGLWSTDWQPLGQDSVRLRWDKEALYIQAVLADEEAFVNKQSGANLWNGDALEVAFAAQPELSTRPRARMLFSDIHLGISLGENPEAIDFRTQRMVVFDRRLIARAEGGYFLEATFKWTDLQRDPWELAGRYLLEIARDQGNASGRQAQIRWNSPDSEGFHNTPSFWGELIVPAKNTSE